MNIKSNRGRVIDMDALAKKNEHTIAVTGGGTSMNARGDLIGVGGKIVKRVEQRDKESEGAIRPEAQKVKLSDMRKFSEQVGQEDLRAQMNQTQNKQRQDALRMAKKVEIATASLANGGQPVIKDYTDQNGDEDVKKPKRVIVDTDE